MQVHTAAVHLPDLDHGITERAATCRENATAQVCDLADGWCDRVVDDQQVIVGIEWQLIGVKGPFGKPRRSCQLLGEGAANAECGNAECKAAAEKATTAKERVRKAHDRSS